MAWTSSPPAPLALLPHLHISHTLPLQVGTPICVSGKNGINLGRISFMVLNHKAVDVARTGQTISVMIESTPQAEHDVLFGRHLDHADLLVSVGKVWGRG